MHEQRPRSLCGLTRRHPWTPDTFGYRVPGGLLQSVRTAPWHSVQRLAESVQRLAE